MSEDHRESKQRAVKDAADRLVAWARQAWDQRSKMKDLSHLWQKDTKRAGNHREDRREAIKIAFNRLLTRTQHKIKDLPHLPYKGKKRPDDFLAGKREALKAAVDRVVARVKQGWTQRLRIKSSAPLQQDAPSAPIIPPPSFTPPEQTPVPPPVTPPSFTPPEQTPVPPFPPVSFPPPAPPPPQIILPPPPVAPPQRKGTGEPEDYPVPRQGGRTAEPEVLAPQPARRRVRRTLNCLGRTISTTFFLLYIIVGGMLGYNFFNSTQTSYGKQVLTLHDLLPPDNLKIYDSQGQLIDQLTDQGIHTEVNYNQVAPALVNATVAVEDRTFWSNQGIDLMSILRSALADLQSGRPIEGGSTITQQLVKLLIVGNSPDITRKLSEIVLAPQVNDHYSKRDIMEMYLNTIYYGHQAYGIDAAATVYFGLEDKPGQSAASQLDLAQAALLAGLPRNTSLYDPFTHPQAAADRLQEVLNAMVAQGYVSYTQAQEAFQEEQQPAFFKTSPTLQDQAPHFDNYVLSQLEQMFHLTPDQLSRSGMIVYTTLDVTLQNKILAVMRQHIAEIRAAHHVANAAEVLIDFHTGAILSMLGSIDYYDNSIDGQYNVALAYRQPGSSFKPYVYATALEQGASPAQAIDDTPTTFNVPGSTPSTYSPQNDDSQFHGHMTLRCALQNSLNVPAVRVLQHVGINNALATAQAMGITSYEGAVGLSMALGGLDVRLLDHTSAMGVFANDGVRVPYYSISKVVQSTTGQMLFQHQSAAGTQAISPQVAYMMTSMLSDNTSRIPAFSDCNLLQLYSNSQQDCLAGDRGTVRPAAVKTGTTQDARDGLAVGYTTDYVMGVWTGNDDNSSMIDISAETSAAPIWHDSMLLAEQGHPIRDFQNPGGLVRATVTYPDGVTSTDWSLPNAVPASHKAPKAVPGSTPAPYCSTYSFAFAPPLGNGIPANGGWW